MIRRRHVLVAALLAACEPTYAPPVHSAQGGAPRPSFDSFMVDVGDVDAVVPGAAGRIPLSDHIAADVGGELAVNLTDTAPTSWTMAHGGLRATTPLRADGLLAADLALGAGIGNGGVSQEIDATGEPHPVGSRSLAYGGYLGAGLGGHGRSFGSYARMSLQLSDSSDDAIPTTRWGGLLAGVQLATGGARFRLAAGLAAYDHRDETQVAPLLEIGLELGGGPPAPPPRQRPVRWQHFHRRRWRR